MWPFSKRGVVQGDGKVLLRDLASSGRSSIGDGVTTEKALGLPAIWAAVNFISGTIAGLPLHVYERSKGERKRVDGPLSMMLNERANSATTSFDWRKYTFERILTSGRAFTLIDRNKAGRVAGLYPLDPEQMEVVREKGRISYRYYENGSKVVYQADEILDIPFMLKPDGVGHLGPVATCRNAIGMALAATEYGGKVFQSGGLPPAVIQGPFASGQAAQRASDDVAKTMANLANEGKSLLALPAGHEVKGVGFSPEQIQMLELQRFLVEQVARIYSLPPVFLQDLTRGTFSNTEQQDLHFVKHTMKRWVEQFEQQINLKLFRQGGQQYAEFSMDGLLRGDIKTRMEAHGTAIQNGIYTPAHAAGLENAPHHDEADQVFIQGGTMPIGTVDRQDSE